MQVRLGAHSFNQNEVTQVRITSTNVVNHERFNVESFLENDISVILLPERVVPSPTIQIIRLAPADTESYAGSRALLTGWGRTSDDSPAVSPVLRSVNLTIISNIVCGSVYGSVILPSNICTSGLGEISLNIRESSNISVSFQVLIGPLVLVTATLVVHWSSMESKSVSYLSVLKNAKLEIQLSLLGSVNSGLG